MADTSVFELRTYHAAPGRLPDLEARFRDHTLELFKRHGIEVVGFWVPLEQPEGDSLLIYVLRFPSREEAATRWQAFQADPDWIETKRSTEVNGVLAPRIESVFMKATDFSPLS